MAKISAQLHVIKVQERHEKSPKKRQLVKPDAAPRGTPHMYNIVYSCRVVRWLDGAELKYKLE